MRLQDKLKLLYLIFYETYDHQTLPAGDLQLVARAHSTTRLIDHVITYEHKTNEKTLYPLCYSLLLDEYGQMLVKFMKFMIRHKYEVLSFFTELTK